MNNEIVPVVFSTNDNYALYCYVAISSLIKVSNPEKMYDIKVFMTRLSENYCSLLESLSRDNVKVECVDVSSIVQNVDLRELSFFSVETFYRLFIPLILRNYEKVIYLDTDLVVIKDVSELINFDLHGHALGVVGDVQCSHLEWHCKDMGTVDFAKAFNAGVLVIDNRAYEKLNIREIGLKLLVEDYKNERRKFIYVDQDVLNSVLNGKVEYLDDRWNFQWQYAWRMDTVYESYSARYLKAEQEPWIIHYAGDKKPWAYPDLPNAQYFWNIARDTVVYEDIVLKSLIEGRADKAKLDCFDVYRFPYEMVPAGSKIAIYAAGAVGKAFYYQLKLSGYAKLTLWVDRNHAKLQEEFGIKPPEALKENENDYEYVIVAIDDEKVAGSIVASLKEMEVPEEKIKWMPYHV